MPYESLVFRWSAESPARVLELQSGNADYVSDLLRADAESLSPPTPISRYCPHSTPTPFIWG